MPDLNELQDEYDELTREIDRQNELRDSDSEEYDWDRLDRANNRRNQVRRDIEEAGGTPGEGQPSTDRPSGGQGDSPPTDEPAPQPPDPSESSIDQLRRELDRLAGNPPHPGVRLEEGKVVGGTAEDFQQQKEWRERVERLEHELTAAQADEAWAAAGGPHGFTDAELDAIERASDQIDAIQARLDAVKRQIAEKNALMDAARGQLDSQTTQGGGPNAASGAAIAVGARIQGELRELHRQEATITQELNAALEALAAIIRGRVRGQLEGGGVEVGLPTDRKGKEAVEDAFLRRVYRRLGLPYLPKGASGLLQGLTGAQSSLFEPNFRLLALVAVAVLVTIGILAMFLLRGDDTSVVAVPSPDTEQVTDDSAVTDATPSSGAAAIGTDDSLVTDDSVAATTPALILPTPATALQIPFMCATVVHSPLVGFPDSYSFFQLAMLVGGVDGPIPEGTTLTVDAGGIAPNSASIDGFEVEVPIPIDSYGAYEVTSVTAEGPSGQLPVDFVIQPFIVDADEGPIDGCMTPSAAEAAGSDLLGEFDELWFGDVPPAVADEPSEATSAPDFEVFLDNLDAAHATGDVDSLLGSLDRATIDRYGSEQCAAYLGEVAGSFADPVLVEATEAPWDYETDGLSTSVPDAWTLRIDVALGGSQAQIPMHVRPLGDDVFWFTDCGEPIG